MLYYFTKGNKLFIIMGDDDLFKDDLHIGKMIKEIAIQKQVSAKKIADAIQRYNGNADKIFKLDDMYVEDIILISYLLKFNFLRIISNKYLSHIPFTGDILKQENFSITLEMPSNSFRIIKKSEKKDRLEVHIGDYIKDVALKKGIKKLYITNQLGRSQGLISYLYKQNTMKIKQLIKISIALNYNFISEVYLSRMDVTFSFHLFDGCIVELTTKHTQSGKLNEGVFSMIIKSKNNEEEQ